MALFANLVLQLWGCASCTVGAVIDDPGLIDPTDSALSDSGSSSDTSLPDETGDSTETGTGKDTSSAKDSGSDGDSGSGKDTAQSKDSGGDSADPKDTGETPVDTGNVEEPGSCSVVLAVDTVVIEEDGVYSDDGAQLWVCGGVTLSYTGNSAAILVEERGGAGGLWQRQSNSRPRSVGCDPHGSQERGLRGVQCRRDRSGPVGEL